MEQIRIDDKTKQAIETVLSKGNRAEIYQNRDEIIVKESRSKIVHQQKK